MTNYIEEEYLDSLHYILTEGEIREDRTGVGTRGIFGLQTHYDLKKGFPAVTTKRLAWKPVVSELLWFLEGSTDERRLAEIQYGYKDPSKTTIWTANADAQGKALGHRNDDEVKELGPIYGKQWRDFGGIDQIETVIHNLRHNPTSRRHIISAWNVPELPEMALPPCHVMIQFHVSNNDELSCQLYQRSADMFLGVPFNVASYSLLTHMIAQICGLDVGRFVHTIGDAHIYLNHEDAVKQQLENDPFDAPMLLMPPFKTLEELQKTQPDDYVLLNYKNHGTIRAQMAI